MSALTSPPAPTCPPAGPQHHRARARAWATGGRFVLAGFFAAMTAVNLVWTLPEAEGLYRDIAESLAWPGVDRAMTELVVPHAATVVVIVAGFELGVSLLLLGRGRAVSWGLALAAVFMVGLFGVVSAYAVANLPLVVLALWLSRREHDRSLVGMLRGR